ncbi:MAG TPA: hypothetical protein VM430_00130 [Microbacterium sp.]|nr:hypothetical protein [Microbacterium sp.]
MAEINAEYAAVETTAEPVQRPLLPVLYDAPEAEPCPFKRGDVVVTPDGQTRWVNSVDVRVHVEVGATCSHFRPSELRFAAPRRALEPMTDDPLDDAPPEVRERFMQRPETPRPEENIVSALAKIARSDEASAQRRWRTGWSLGRTLYCDGICVGMVDRPDIAESIVIAMNASHATEASHTPLAGAFVLAKGRIVSREEGQVMVRFSHGYAWVNEADLEYDAEHGYRAGWSAAIQESAKLCERWAWSKRTEDPPEQAMAAEECATKIRALLEKGTAR